MYKFITTDMDTENTNPGERKPRRPRIGQNRPSQQPEGGYRRAEYDAPAQGFNPQSPDDGEHMRRTYPRRQEGFYERRQQQGGYNREGYQSGYQHPQGGYQRQQRSQEGYQQRSPEGYQHRSQDGYQPRTQGGYQQRQQGGYGNNRQGGYNNNNRRPGGYNHNQNRQGGYYDNAQRQEGYSQPQRRQPGQYQNSRPGQGGYGQNQRRSQGAFPGKGKSFTPRPRQVEYEIPIPDPNEQIRLNKYMANSGICSRREADEFIQQGLVKVNGEVVTALGTNITHSDVVEYDDKVVALQRKCYVLLNKPKDCVTTSDDPNGRLTVMDIVKDACKERIYPVGRLDRNTTGVLLLTNDGDLASKLTHPKYVKKKIYHVWTDRDISEEDMQRIADGIELEDGPIQPDAISYATETDRNQAGIEIHSGRNRIVRRIFEHLGYRVTKLDRVYFAGLTKKNLPRGRWRYLTQEEVNFLKMGSFE